MSKIQLSPYVNFQGRAREAMGFYHTVLGGKLDLLTVNEQGVSKPAGPGDSIRYSRLEADGALIIATDGHPDYPTKLGDAMAIALGGTDKDRLARIFTRLGEGGNIRMQLSKQPSGAEVGWLTDKFGISWTVTVDNA